MPEKQDHVVCSYWTEWRTMAGEVTETQREAMADYSREDLIRVCFMALPFYVVAMKAFMAMESRQMFPDEPEKWVEFPEVPK